jgi:peroxiredoxin
VRAFELTSFDGKTVSVPHTDGRTLLFFFSPDCVHCWRQAAAWREVLERARGRGVQVVGVAKPSDRQEDVLAMIHDTGLSQLPVYAATEEALARWGVQGTPTTLLLARGGRVQGVWLGRWAPETYATALALIEGSGVDGGD